MIVVTGANGFLGNNLVRQLLDRQLKVRCMVRPTSDLSSLADLDVETVTGDLRDPASLLQAFRGAEQVYNLAGVIAIAPGRERLMSEVNAEGAARVAEACLAANVRRLCHVSSCHALKLPPHPEDVFDERQPFDPEMRMIYGRTKALGALAVLEAHHSQGLDAVVACPTGIVGPRDFRPSEMGATIADYARGRLAAITPGGYDFVDVRDVASGLIALADQGRSGEYYLLSGQQVSISWLVTELSKLLGERSKPRPVGGPLLYLIADLVTVASRLAGARPRITRDALDTLLSNANFTHAKATADVGYQPRALAESLSDAVAWFRASGRIN